MDIHGRIVEYIINKFSIIITVDRNPQLDYDEKKSIYGPLTIYVKLRIAHAPGMPGTFSPPTDFKGNR